jgi:predicted translin family RNA/ssDNA-binding protein
MIKEINSLKKELDKHEALREAVIKSTRTVIKLSKLVIFEIHRTEKATAQVHAMKNEMRKLRKLVSKNLKLKYTGGYKVAEQEYVEALAYVQYRKSGTLPTWKELGCEPEYYLLGICDFASELVRTATQFAIDGNIPAVEVLKELVSQIHGELLKIDLRGELRKKADMVRWSLNKMADLVSQAKLSGK